MNWLDVIFNIIREFIRMQNKRNLQSQFQFVIKRHSSQKYDSHDKYMLSIFFILFNFINTKRKKKKTCSKNV